MRSPLEVLVDERQNPYGRIVLVDDLALSGQALQMRKHHIATVGDPLNLIPLRRIGHRDPQHGLIGFNSEKG